MILLKRALQPNFNFFLFKSVLKLVTMLKRHISAEFKTSMMTLDEAVVIGFTL